VRILQAQQLDDLLKNIQTAVTLLKQTEQQPPGTQQPATLRAGGTAAGTGTHTLLPRSSSSMAYRDMEEGTAGTDAGTGNFALSDKIRTVWSTVGRMAGFLPPVEGLGHQESLQSPHALPSTLVMHSTFSTASGEASPHPGALQHLQLANQAAAGSGDLGSVLGAAGSSTAAGGYRAAAARQLGGGQSERPITAAGAGAAAGGASSAAGAPAAAGGYQQSRSGRVLGSSGGTGSLPGISVADVYPNV
jgi:hypothetical protein